MIDPLACDRVPAAWPTSVPPVMVILAPEACFSVMIPSTVLESIPSSDVHRGFDLLEQLPLETMEIPAARIRDSASDCVSFKPGAVTERKCDRKAYETHLFSSGRLRPSFEGLPSCLEMRSDCSVEQDRMGCLVL